MAFQLTVTRLGNCCLSPVTELFPQQQAGRAAITLPWKFFFGAERIKAAKNQNVDERIWMESEAPWQEQENESAPTFLEG